MINASSNAKNVADVISGNSLFIFDAEDENPRMTMKFAIPIEIGKIKLVNPQNLKKFEVTTTLTDTSVHTFLVSEMCLSCIFLCWNKIAQNIK